MQRMRSKRIVRSVNYIPVEDIVPGVMQPRQHFSPEGLAELRDSIIEHGVIQPLTVRMRGERFELIAGERRLRAAKLAGLFEVPCIIIDVDIEDSGVIALIENIQRRDLDFVEEAEGISQLIRLFGMSQEEAAKRLGKSQSAIANKLRILRLPSDVLEQLREADLTQRHARALLRLEGAEQQRMAADFMVDQRMTVAAAEAYVDMLVQGKGKENTATEKAERLPPRKKTERRRGLFVMKDVRLFTNSLNRSLDVMRRGGIEADLSRSETDRELVFTVRIPKR